MAGRGTDILLGGSPKGIARVLAKHLMLVKLGLSEQPIRHSEEEEKEDEDETVLEVSTSTDGSEQVSEEVVEEETDEDVLSLPSIKDLAASLELWMPGKLSKVYTNMYIYIRVCVYE